MVRHGVEQGPALTRRIAPVIAVVAVFYAVVVPLRIQQHSTIWFAHVGSAFLHSAHSSPAIDSVETPESEFGYDGQFYFYIAADPAHARDYMHVGTDDQSGIRYARIVYPGLSWALSGGSVRLLPSVMLALNLLAIGVGVWAIALWLKRRGRSPWFAVLYGLWPGMVYAVIRDLSEPVAYCLAALAVLVFDARSPRRTLGAAALLALSLLTRETTIAFALGLAFAIGLHERGWRRPLGFLALAIGPMVVWRAILTAWLHVTTIESSTAGWKAVLPFYGMYSRYPFDAQHRLLFWTIDVPLVAAAAGALYLLYRRRDVAAAVLLLLNAALFVVFIPKNVTIDWGAAARNATPVLLAALYCVPAVRSRAVLSAGALLLSPLWYLAVAAFVGVPGFVLMTR